MRSLGYGASRLAQVSPGPAQDAASAGRRAGRDCGSVTSALCTSATRAGSSARLRTTCCWKGADLDAAPEGGAAGVDGTHTLVSTPRAAPAAAEATTQKPTLLPHCC